jgi:hypothetical protein
MEIPVTHKLFLKQKLTVCTADWFIGPKLILNGLPLKRARGAYSAEADNGDQVVIRFKTSFIDPIPTVRIGDDLIYLARKLEWHEYIWAALPIVLLFIGGALGAVAGILGSYCNFRILRSDRGGIMKYVLSGFTTLAAAILFFVAATAFQLFIRNSA